jgi:prevent-host-death family protein
MINVNTHSAKTNLSALLLKVENTGEQVTICRNGKPVARLSPIKRLGRNSRSARGSQIIEIMKGRATEKLSTDEIMELTRGI